MPAKPWTFADDFTWHETDRNAQVLTVNEGPTGVFIESGLGHAMLIRPDNVRPLIRALLDCEAAKPASKEPND